MPSEAEICGVLLAGGQSRRMGGGDKCLLELEGRTLLRRSLDAIAPQVGPLVINTNSAPALFADYSLPVVPDVIDGFPGPLAGVLTGMDWAVANAPQCEWVASFACDAPFLPGDVVDRMYAAVLRDGADMACTSSGGRHHPVFALWPVKLATALRDALLVEGLRKVDAWTARYRLAVADFETGDIDPFFNINRPEDIDQAAALLDRPVGGQLGT